MPSPAVVGLFYFLHIGVVGILMPFLPGYLTLGLGLDPTGLGAVLAVGPLMGIWVPPLWGYLADRSGDRAATLWRASVLSLIGLGLLATLDRARWAPLVLVVFYLGFAGITPLLDAIALGLSVPYVRLRQLGSIGFATMALGYSLVLRQRPELAGSRVTVLAAFGVYLAAALVAVIGMARLGRRRPVPGLVAVPGAHRTDPPPRPRLGDVGALLANRDFRLLALAAMLHWIAQGPYNGFLALIMKERGLDGSATGRAFALAVLAEIIAMSAFGRLQARWPVRPLLLLSFLSSALRWALCANAASEVVLVALQAFHGLTFGVFYLSAVSHVRTLTPERLAASGQAVFSACAFGIGGVSGYLLAGASFASGGGGMAFGTAALLELAAALVLVLQGRARATSPT